MMSELNNRVRYGARNGAITLAVIAALSLASFALLLGEVDSQGRYARMIDEREQELSLVHRAALLARGIAVESPPNALRPSLDDSIREIDRLQRVLATETPGETPGLDRELVWFLARTRSWLAHPDPRALGAADPELAVILDGDAHALPDAFAEAIGFLRRTSLQSTRAFQAAGASVLAVLLLTLGINAKWILFPLERAIREETRALMESRQRMDAVLRTVGEAIILADPENVILAANPEAARVWGYAPEELPGLKLNALVLPGQELAPPAWREMFPLDRRVETAGIRKGGEPFGLEMLLNRTQIQSSGESQFFTLSARDITERLEAARQLAKARDAALEAARGKGAFVAALSQGIRTPINGILSLLDLLGDSGLDAAQRKLVGTIRGAGQNLSAIVNDVLDFSSMESGKLALELVDFDLRQLVENTGDVLAGRAVKKQLELLAFLEPGVPTALRGDPGRLRQVLLNLLSNALTFTQSGEVTVRVELEREEEWKVALRFSVEDTGPGIPPEAHEHLFNAYSQPEALASRPGSGPGFGLPISRQLVELMGGQLDFRSIPGKGSRFSFGITFEKQPAPLSTRTSLQEEEAAAFLNGARILVVDDNAACRELVTARLRAWGAIAADADSAGEALTQLREAALAGTPFAAAMLDLNLGSMDGFTLAWAVSSQPLLSGTRLILMTAIGLQGDAAADRKVGIAATVSKPLKHDAVLQALRKALDTGASPAPVAPARAPIHSGGHRVLLADDNPINRKMTLRQLANLGYEADAVSNGHEVLAAIRAQSYALVLLDMHMPELDGYRTAEIIRHSAGQNGEETQLKLIAMTANRTPGDRERCLAAGMNDYLPKPVNQNDLGRILHRWNPADQQLA